MATLKELIEKGELSQKDLDDYEEEKTSGLKANRDKANTKRASVEADLEIFNNLGGIDVFKQLIESAKTSKADLDAAKLDKAEKDGNYDTIVKDRDATIVAKDELIVKMTASMVNEKVNSQITKSISDHGGNMNLLQHVLASRVSGKMTDEGIVIIVNDADGNVMHVDGNKATVDQLVVALKADESYGAAFAGSNKSGANSKQSNSNPPSNTTVIMDSKDKNFNMTKAMEFATEHPEEAQRLAEEAGLQVS